ncbi:MAG: hypothetical protein ACTSU5_19205 [Promethearchaeota archaeon]
MVGVASGRQPSFLPQLASSRPEPGGTTLDPINEAPANLTAIVVSTGEIEDKAMNTSVQWFRDDWSRIFGASGGLPLVVVDLNQSGGGLDAGNKSLVNGSLVVGAACGLFNYSWPVPGGEDAYVVTPWENSTYGHGWAVYGGSVPASVRVLSFRASTLSKYDAWGGTENRDPRLSYLIGGAPGSIGEGATGGWEATIKSFEDNLKVLTRRCYTGFVLSAQFETFSNISLPGYEEPGHADLYADNLARLSAYIDQAARYHLKLYLNTDELVLTQAQRDWLLANLNYSGVALKGDYPPHLHGDAPGLWTFLQAKYDAVVDSLALILNDTNREGFGGFYFRTDDLSNPYPYKYAVLSTTDAFGHFINLTTAAAARLNATVIQRMWRLGEGENAFNNATIARELLDPINATNLVLRCKETWNDHWYDHPPNPVIGVSHHPWIIGWYAGAAMPDYKGGYFEDFFRETGWLDNPNVVGYDFPGLASASFDRLDHQPFVSANHHYLFVKAYYPSLDGNQTLELYFHQVGVADAGVIERLTAIFNKAHEAFRLLSFWQAWASTGKFKGDVLNGGNTVLFSPGRFNMFFEAVRASNYTIEFTITEGYNGCALAVEAFDEFPIAYGGEPLPAIRPGYLDPEYASDASNITEQLLALRGNFRQFADFARIFAAYRAWFLTFYLWGETWNPSSWWRSEKYREETLAAYREYQETWGDTSYWYQVNFREFGEFWIPIVGNTNLIRLSLLVAVGILALGTAAFQGAYGTAGSRRERGSLAELLLGKLGRKLTESRGSEGDLRGPGQSEAVPAQLVVPGDTLRLILGALVVPAFVTTYYYFTFLALSNCLIPLFAALVGFAVLSLFVGTWLAQLVFCRGGGGHDLHQQAGEKGEGEAQGNWGRARLLGALYPTGLVYPGVLLFAVPFVALMFVGGIFVVTASDLAIVVLGASLGVGGVYSAALFLRNQPNLGRQRSFLLVLVAASLSVATFIALTLPWGGPASLVDEMLAQVGGI